MGAGMTLQFADYTVTDQIYTGKHSVIFKGIKNEGRIPVVIKYLNKEFPSTDNLNRFTREYHIIKNLSGTGIIRVFGLEKHLNSLAMITEDFGGDSLLNHLAAGKPGHEECIRLAIAIADAVSQIHQQAIIHKDINPANILWNRQMDTVKIIDFGISSELSRENQEVRHPNILEGTIAYMSPEQTGRMNRTMDYRTDMYSLGATLYELFTGRQPFKAADAMGLVHCHIAVMPRPPHVIDEAIPEALSKIVMKLLAKAPEDRYQSISGLKNDLEFCLEHICEKKEIINFHPGRYDISGRFQIPQKLYGRNEEIKILLAAFERISKGQKNLMLVAGYSGVGKSALVHEINKPIVALRGNFISGKFDQFKRNIPYSALIQAFQYLVKNLLAEHDETLRKWKAKLLNALGPSGQIVIDVIPEMELIIGKQPPVQELDPDQARNRFNIVFQNFIRVFADTEHPLVIFIDDLQWTDLPSLHLIEQFMTDVETRHLLIIGSYRDNEVDRTHPLMMALETMRKQGIPLNTIELKPLGLSHVNHLIADSLYCDQAHSEPLSRLCHEKTLGNPFFLYQLLYSLYEDKSLVFDARNGVWNFDVKQIRQADITENVVDLMIGKIRKLKPVAQDVLKLASCIGNTFDLTTLAMVGGKSRTETARLLFEPLEELLIIPVDDSYKFIDDSQTQINVEYRFLHDRILQAAYSLVSDMDRKNIHLSIGRLMLKNAAAPVLEEKLFDIVNHLNLGAELISKPEELNTLADLNLRAGIKAKLSAAYKPSGNYLQKGIVLSGDNGWGACYHRMLTLHNETMECAYLSMDYVRSAEIFDIINRHALSVIDKARSCEIKILSLMAESRFTDVMETGLGMLKQLDVHLPPKPKKFNLITSLVKTKILLIKHTDETIMELKPMTDRLALSRVSILRILTAPALFSTPDLYPLIIFKRVELSLLYGKDPLYSFSSFSSLGLILCSLGRIEEGYRYGQLAERLLSRSTIKKEKTRVVLILNMFIRHWKDPIRETVKPLLAAYESRVETGDIEYASHAVCAYCLHIFASGMNLTFVDREQAGFLKSIRLLKQKFDEDNIGNFHQATLNLMNREKPLTDYSGTSFDESVMIPILEREGNKTALYSYHVDKLYLYYLAGEYTLACDQIPKVNMYLTSVRSLVVVPFFNLYESLTRLALCHTATAKEKKAHLSHVVRNQKKMAVWAKHAPMNYRHKWHLVEAEKAWVQNQPDTAKTNYKLAVKGAKENEFKQEEALANERFALFLQAEGDEDYAGLVMKKARYCYDLWGAGAKVVHLEKAYPHLLRLAADQENTEGIRPRTSELFTPGTKQSNFEILDLTTLMKASRMLSREIVLSRLIEKMLMITMENVGAERGFVLMEDSGKFFIEGEAAIGREGIKVLQSIPVEEHMGISAAIVNYVARTKKIVILDDAANEGPFIDDPYIIRNRPKSILCNAILNQDRITAIIYVENNLSTAAFRLERMEILNALASQAAISITNARLYENLEQKVRERTEELNLSLNEVQNRTEELDITLKKVENANEKIMSSIRYSGIIQHSLLPDASTITAFLPQSFFIWKPRDIVGGDIYVCEKLETGIIVAVIDCTGHGVPGAFMTMLAGSGLRRIIREDGIYQPAQILKQLNRIIKTSLQQDTEHARSDDGLDAGVCYFNYAERTVFFSGARIPLLYMDQGNLVTVKGDKISLGYVSSDLAHEFTTHRIENPDLSKSFYLATDGFSDQLGGEDTSRFGSHKLRELLVKHHRLPFDQQRRILLEAFEEHRGANERTDDVTVAGFKFNGTKDINPWQ